MNIKTYYQKLNTKSQAIFSASLKDQNLIGKTHNAASELFQLSNLISDNDERTMIQVVSTQIETSSLALTLGLYRPALATLRLAFELGIATVYFSANKFAHREWMNGKEDLRWSNVNSSEDGVLSKRFSAAFFPELADHCSSYFDKAQDTYRCLSEYVHGNSETWKKSGIVLAKNDALSTLYSRSFAEVSEILKFAFCCRYLKQLTPEQVDEVSALLCETFNHIAPLRAAFGGPGEIK